MKKLRQIVGWVLLLSMLFSLPAFAAEEKIAAYQDDMYISINGTYMDAHNYAIDNNLFMPLRAVSEGFGYEITWNDDRSIDLSATKTQEPTLNSMEYRTPPTPKAASFMVHKDDLTIRVNGEMVETPHFLYKGTTYVPLQFFYDTLHCHIFEDPTIGAIKIYSPEFIAFQEDDVLYYDGTMLNSSVYKDLYNFLTFNGSFSEMDITYLRAAALLGEKMVTDENYSSFLESNQIDVLFDQLQIQNKELMKELFVKALFYQYEIDIDAAKAYYVPSEEALQAELAKSKYASGKWMKAKHILIMETEDDSAKTLAEEILAKLEKNPEDFDKLMAEYSEDPGSKTYPEGYIFREGDMVPEFYNGALALAEGEISDVVKSQYGYHIIKKVADYENGVPYTEVKDELHAGYAEEQFQKDLSVTAAYINTVVNRDYFKQPEK